MIDPVGGPGDLVEEVLDLVDLVPPGRATTYGDLADLVGRGGPRQVGQVMQRYAGGVPWWRVVRADGTLPGDLHARATEEWLAEGTPTRVVGGRLRVELGRARWQGPART